MKRAPRSLQHHVLYRKYNGQDSEISALLGKCGFNGRKLIESPTSEQGHLLNLQLTTEVSRLDANERLDTLIEIQRELLATQKAILEELRKS